MYKKISQTFVTLSLAFSLGIFFTGCKFIGQAPTENSAPRPAPQKSIDGTTDGGGGNGLENKPYESFIVDPTQLPEFVKVKAALTKFYAGVADFDFKKSVWTTAARSKTWYIAPVTLTEISKEIVGVNFFANSQQQLAVQKSKEIWIDKRLFESMKPEDRSLLILHEIVMSVYLMKYKTLEEICLSENEVQGLTRDCSRMTAVDENIVPETFSPLKSADYERIRKLTSYIFLSSVGGANQHTLEQKLFANQFDPRLFFAKDGAEGLEPLTGTYSFSTDIVPLMFQRAQSLNELPRWCYFTDLKIKSKCLISFAGSAKGSVSDKKSIFEFMATDEDTKEVIYKHHVEFSGRQILASRMVHFNTHEVYVVIPLKTDTDFKSNEELIRIPVLVARVKKDSGFDEFRLEGIVSVALQRLEKIKVGNKTVCRFGIPSSLTKKSDAIISGGDDKIRGAIGFFVKTIKPILAEMDFCQ